MKKIRIAVMAVIGVFCLFLSGCGYGLVALAVPVIDIYLSETTDDIENLARFSVKEAQRATEAVAQEMGIEITERKEDGKGGILLKGHSSAHERIDIALEPVTGMTKISIKARKKKIYVPIFGNNEDSIYALALYNAIEEKCRGDGAYADGRVDAVTGATVKMANVREGPGVNYKIVAVAPKGSELIFLDEEGNWLKVKLIKTGRVGYIYNTLARPNGI